MNAPTSHAFRGSGLRLDVDLADRSYVLGGIDRGDGEFWQSGPIPTDAFAGFSSAPHYAPGWYVAIGAVDGIAIDAIKVEAAAEDSRRDGAPDEQWVPVDHCVLGECLWAAELSDQQRWLRLTTADDVFLWHRLLRGRGAGTER